MFSVEYLNQLRSWEIERISTLFRPGARILEIGAGTGQQSAALLKMGFGVEAIEVPNSVYSGDRLFPIRNYDGDNIPFPDESFDIVFSSNVLEHVPNLARVHEEVRRVLKPDGYAVHVVPTHIWRFWSTTTTIWIKLRQAFSVAKNSVRRSAGVRNAFCEIRQLLRASIDQRPHGVRGNIISEHWLFHPRWWRKNFTSHGFTIEKELPGGIFYTGNMAMGNRLTTGERSRLARILGSACHIFVLRAVPQLHGSKPPVQEIRASSSL